nr:YfhO family protein [Nitrospina gracilis]
MRGEGLLWRLENYDPNWKAWVDGKETPIRKVPPNFQAIPLEPGRHEILFKYDSPYHFLLYGHILIGVLGMIGFAAWLRNPTLFMVLYRR